MQDRLGNWFSTILTLKIRVRLYAAPVETVIQGGAFQRSLHWYPEECPEAQDKGCRRKHCDPGSTIDAMFSSPPSEDS